MYNSEIHDKYSTRFKKFKTVNKKTNNNNNYDEIIIFFYILLVHISFSYPQLKHIQK